MKTGYNPTKQVWGYNNEKRSPISASNDEYVAPVTVN